MKKMNLHGEWAFRLDAGMQGVEGRYFEQEFDDTILLPATTSEAQKGEWRRYEKVEHLSEPYAFEGFAWYRREIDMDEIRRGYIWELYLERTRISHVWLNGKKVGMDNSLCTPHRYEVTPYLEAGRNTIVVMVQNVGYPTKGGHMTSPDTQTNWNGILGKIELREKYQQYFTDIQIYPDYQERGITVKGRTSQAEGDLYVSVYEGADEVIAPVRIARSALKEADGDSFSAQISVGNRLEGWSEYTPRCYRMVAEIRQAGNTVDMVEVPFGLRSFAAAEDKFLINGMPVFLRGKHDGMIFPLNGYAPMDVDGWLKVMKIARDYGINHYRFHTCCPPEAAFEAADQLGIYLEPELPFWGTITVSGQEGHDEAMQKYLIQEGFRILKEYGNHPSFVMFSLGNELWGSKERLNQILSGYKAYDRRHLYVQGSNNFQFTPCILEEDDFFSGVRFSRDRLFRGSYAMCDAPQGHIQLEKPGTLKNYDEAIRPDQYSGKQSMDMQCEGPGGRMDEGTEQTSKKTTQIQFGTGVKEVELAEEEVRIPHIPVVSHEIGQYVTFPDFREIDKYTGVLRAENLEIFRERLKEKGLLHKAGAFFENSGKLAAQCYKEELETAVRTDTLAGYQLLDLQDFSGQGTALVGILDAFMENKGIISQAEWNQFCAPITVLACFESYVQGSGSPMKCQVKISNYSQNALQSEQLVISLESENGRTYGQEIRLDRVERGLVSVAEVELTMPDTSHPQKLKLSLQLSGEKVVNTYTIWVYPQAPVSAADNLSIVYTRAELEEQLDEQSRILFIAPPHENPLSVEGTYCTDFWCYPMFRSISESMNKPLPVGTLGLCIEKEHPALAYFPTESFSTPQWWEIVSNSCSTILDETQIEPIVGTIDNFERNHRLGLLYEVQVGKSRVLICTADFSKLDDDLPASWLRKSLVEYLSAQENEAEYQMEKSTFLDLFYEEKKKPL